MGFDDIVFDLGLEDTIMKPFIDNPELLTQYSEDPTRELLREWEDEHTKYCGYSLAFHLLYQIRLVHMQGSMVDNPKTCDYTWCKKQTREHVCKKFLDYYESIEDTPAYKLVHVEKAHEFYAIVGSG